jgi:hypothetical protein
MISTLHTRLHPFRKLTIHPVMSVSGPAFPGTNISIKTTDYFDLNSFSSSFTYLLYQKTQKVQAMSVSPFSQKYRQNVSYVRSPRTNTSSTKILKSLGTDTCPSPLYSVLPLLIYRKQSSIGHVRFESTHGPKIEQLPSYELSHLSPPLQKKRETQCLLAISSPIISQGLHYIISLSSPTLLTNSKTLHTVL